MGDSVAVERGVIGLAISAEAGARVIRRLCGRAFLFAHADLSVAGADGATKLNAKVAMSTPAPLAGVGCRYEFSERWHVKVEFDHYDGVGDGMSTGGGNVNVGTLGVGYLFRED